MLQGAGTEPLPCPLESAGSSPADRHRWSLEGGETGRRSRRAAAEGGSFRGQPRRRGGAGGRGGFWRGQPRGWAWARGSTWCGGQPGQQGRAGSTGPEANKGLRQDTVTLSSLSRMASQKKVWEGATTQYSLSYNCDRTRLVLSQHTKTKTASQRASSTSTSTLRRRQLKRVHHAVEQVKELVWWGLLRRQELARKRSWRSNLAEDVEDPRQLWEPRGQERCLQPPPVHALDHAIGLRI